MKRHKSLVPLSMDHHHGLIAAQFCKKNSPSYKNMPGDPEGKRKYILAFGEVELADHFKLEEEVLIPLLIGKNDELDKMIQRVLKEHQWIIELIRKLELADDVELALDNFARAVDSHIRFEEREWFENIQKIANVDLLNEIDMCISSTRPKEKTTNF